uniref:NADH-ubiquinone oxidoreductase chain 4L n=1 Tax=Camaenella platyodon TaxID=2566149 RepID=A0A4D6SYM8_9EUPU|nr:NADH dehydrogenase subunit 4L [Camaenella platyodon]
MMMQHMIMMHFSVLLLLLFGFIFINKCHLLASLISLEVMMYLVLMNYLILSCTAFWSMTYFITLLCFAAAGAALGLSLLVTMGRLYGNDLINSLN